MKYPLAEILKDSYLRDCSKNAIIPESVRDNWLQDCLLFFQENPNEHLYYTTSGDSIVIGHRVEDEGVIQLWDAKLIRAATIPWENKNETTVGSDELSLSS